MARSKTRIRRRYHFGPGGVLYIFVTLLIALGAFNSGNNLLYWSFGFALALLLVSGAVSGVMLMGLRVEREWVSGASVGGQVRVRYRVRNIGRLVPAFALTIEERGFEEPTPVRRHFWSRRAPAPAANASSVGPVRTFVAHVGAGEVLHVEARAAALRRGPVTLEAIRVHTGFPFGLMRKSILITQHATAVITPQPLPVSESVLRSVADAAQAGSPSRRPGRGEEFFALREYVHGDSPRDVAWRASARRGALLVRQFAAPAPLRLWIVLNLRTHPGSDAEDERAIRIAAGLAQAAESHAMEYGLAAPLTRLLVHPRRGPGHSSRVMRDLGLLDLGPDDGRGARGTFPGHASAGGGACVVVHAGEIDRSFGPRRESVLHISSATDSLGGTGGSSPRGAHARTPLAHEPPVPPSRPGVAA